MSLSLSLLSSVFFGVDVSPFFLLKNGLERSKMVHGGLCTVSMEVYYEPLYMSQMVLKEANSGHIHKMVLK